jgi:PleD family two-component response regulator
VTISVGCAAGVEDPAAMILGAAQAMRQAKAGGKNRVAAAGPPAD